MKGRRRNNKNTVRQFRHPQALQIAARCVSSVPHTTTRMTWAYVCVCVYTCFCTRKLPHIQLSYLRQFRNFWTSMLPHPQGKKNTRVVSNDFGYPYVGGRNIITHIYIYKHTCKCLSVRRCTVLWRSFILPTVSLYDCHSSFVWHSTAG